MKIYYSPPSELEIAGNFEALKMVKQVLLKLAAGQAGTIAEIAAESGQNPAPYERMLAKMIIRVGDGPTYITLQNHSAVCVEGSPDNLERLASFFEFDPGAGDGQHRHYEYFEGNEYIAPSAIPFVIHLETK